MNEIETIISRYFRTTNFAEWKIENVIVLLSKDPSTLNCLTKEIEADVKDCLDKQLELITDDTNFQKNAINKAKKLRNSLTATFAKRLGGFFTEQNNFTSERELRELRDNVLSGFSSYDLYRKFLLDNQTHHIEEVAQNTRDNIDLLKYYVLDNKIFQSPDRVRRPELLKPIVNLSRIKDALLELNNNRIRNATNFLDKLISDNTVGNRSLSFSSLFKQKKGFYIDTPTALSAVTSVVHYIPVPSSGLGSDPSENHVKCQLWAKLLSDSFSHYGEDYFKPIWEMHHLFPGSGGKGSGRSDFATVYINEH